ncbi:hypothetical protein [Alkaliphilus transvaalensis]|uniref:hypothetical protein n=1 Tax=Alkaliphilus transvaalensis TaxID=114628 RepID=UPI00047EF750|nr:hypothetical protein [Alkaliphilus transvaalensis]
MNYFKILGILFGTIAFLKPVYMHLLPWDENSFLEKTYVERRPVWIVPVAVAAFLLVGFTWYKHIVSNIPYSIILAILFTFIAIKSIIFIFNYEKFQVWVAKMLRKDKGKDVLLIDIGVGIFGLVILLLAIFIY